MSFSYIQKDTDDWMGQYVEGYWPPKDIFLRLDEENSEIGQEIKKHAHTSDNSGIGKEIADLLFTVCCMANSHQPEKIDLDQEWQNLMKEKYDAVGKLYHKKMEFGGSLDDVQKNVEDVTKRYKQPYEAYADISIAKGELARELNHLYGSKKKKASEKPNTIEKTISEMLFATVYLANIYHLDLGKEWDAMLKKLYKRDKDRYERIISERT